MCFLVVLQCLLIWKARFSGRTGYLFTISSYKIHKAVVIYLKNNLNFNYLITLEGCGGFFPFTFFFPFIADLLFNLGIVNLMKS